MIERFLQRSHLGEQTVVVRLGVGQGFRDFVEPGHHRFGLGDAFFNVFEHRLVRVEVWFLQQDADRRTWGQDRVTVRRMV